MKLSISKIISNGDGIGWADGKTFFVPFVIDGEEIEVISSKQEKNYWRVEQFELITPSPKRRTPCCPNFGVCGGCCFLHIDYAKQLEIKTRIVEEFFRQQKLEIPSQITTLSVGEFGSRTRAKVKIEKGKPCFMKRGSHDMIFFTTCPLIDPVLNNIILNDAEKKMDGEVQYEYSSYTRQWIPDQKQIVRQVCGKDFVQSQGSFFQSSEKSAEALAGLVNSVVDKEKPSSVLDLFCGIGLFSSFAADRGIKVTGIELSPSSVSDFKKNLGNKGKIIKDNIERIKKIDKHDMIIIDPPRNGCGKAASNLIAQSASKGIVYISCSPATFVRDYIEFAKYGFSIKQLVVLDLFPNTHHCEILVFLQR